VRQVRSLIAALCCTALTAAPALAAPAVVGNANIGSHFQASGVSTSNVITTTTDAPVGSLIFMATGFSGTQTISSVTDSAGNPYTAENSIQLGSKRDAFYWSDNTATDLPAPATATGSITTTTVTFTTNPGTLGVGQAITGTGVTASTQITGGISQWNGTSASATVNNSQTVGSETLTISSTITTTFGASNATMGAMAWLISGAPTASPIETTGRAQASGTSSAGTNANALVTVNAAAGSLVLACVHISGANTSDSYTEDATVTNIAPRLLSSGNLGFYCVSWLATGVSKTWTPTWTNSRTWTSWSTAVKSTGGTASVCLLMMTGVGKC
jgi:hypothetical protein